MILCDLCGRTPGKGLTFLKLILLDPNATDTDGTRGAVLDEEEFDLCPSCRQRAYDAALAAVRGLRARELRQAVPSLTPDQASAVETYYQK